MTTTEQSYETSPQLRDSLKRSSSIAAFVGLVFLALTVAGKFLPGGSDQQFLRAYLVGFWLWFGASAASLGFLMVQYLTGGAWGTVIRRPLEAGAKTLYVMSFGFLPLLIWVDKLYWWATPAGLADKVIQAKELYLNVPFLWVRWVVYTVFLIGFTYLLTKWSKEEDDTKSTKVSARLEALSAPGVLIFFLLMTFCSVDYLMVLEPYWYSTIYGFLTIIGWGLTTMAIMIAVLVSLTKDEPMHYAITKKHFHDLGKLLFALVMLWAYLNFSQVLITYSANLPTEIVWYIKRWNGGFGWVSVLLLIGHFMLPFFLLISQPAKKTKRVVQAIAIYIVLIHAVDVYSLVEPNFTTAEHPQLIFSWLDVTAPLGFGGLWLALFFRNLSGQRLLPIGAPDFVKALNHGRDH
ncbi:MAG: hypothetical protein EBY17_11280 [Acidobacteriia bacterium]|nr:hypothetical protein [Terriglobia bacterium]